jgi:hypothetical protein
MDTIIDLIALTFLSMYFFNSGGCALLILNCVFQYISNSRDLSNVFVVLDYLFTILAALWWIETLARSSHFSDLILEI